MLESTRILHDEALQLEGRIYGHCPVQAEGTVAGKAFYFRARWDAWSFAVADSVLDDPVDIQLPGQGFLCEGDYDDASWMSYDDAEALIRRYAQEFLATQATE
jgi:hypothetical protein